MPKNNYLVPVLNCPFLIVIPATSGMTIVFYLVNLEQKLFTDQDTTIGAILDSIDSRVFSVDRAYCYTCFNAAHAAAMKKIYGVEIQLGNSLAEYRSVQMDREKAQHNLDRALRGEQFTESAYFGEEGLSRRFFEVAHNPIRNEKDEVIGVSVIARDITEHKKTEELLRQSERKFRLLLMNANDAVYVHEVSSAGGGNFIEVNDKACEMLGYTREELLSMSIPDVDTPEHTDKRVPWILENLFLTKKAIFETEHLAKNGRRIPVEVSIRLFELQGKPTVLSVVRDISERKKIEEELQKARKLESLGLLAGGIAHDFNNYFGFHDQIGSIAAHREFFIVPSPALCNQLLTFRSVNIR